MEMMSILSEKKEILILKFVIISKKNFPLFHFPIFSPVFYRVYIWTAHLIQIKERKWKLFLENKTSAMIASWYTEYRIYTNFAISF